MRSTNDAKVLLVDDIDFFLEMGRDYLNQTQVEVMTAQNGQQALEMALRERPQLIYMDVIMPVMDGVTCCRQLKSDDRLRQIPVVMLFAGSKEITPDTCRKAGCDGVLRKPVDRESFLNAGRPFLEQLNRRGLRVPCQTEITLQQNGNETRATAIDLSASGMYISTPLPAVRDESIRFSARFSVGTAIGEIVARVAWVNQGEGRKKPSLPPGFGIEFVQTNASTRLIIQQELAKLTPRPSMAATRNFPFGTRTNA